MTARRSRVPDDLTDERSMRAMHDRHDRIHLTIGDQTDLDSGTAVLADVVAAIKIGRAHV